MEDNFRQNRAKVIEDLEMIQEIGKQRQDAFKVITEEINDTLITSMYHTQKEASDKHRDCMNKVIETGKKHKTLQHKSWKEMILATKKLAEDSLSLLEEMHKIIKAKPE